MSKLIVSLQTIYVLGRCPTTFVPAEETTIAQTSESNPIPNNVIQIPATADPCASVNCVHGTCSAIFGVSFNG